MVARSPAVPATCESAQGCVKRHSQKQLGADYEPPPHTPCVQQQTLTLTHGQASMDLSQAAIATGRAAKTPGRAVITPGRAAIAHDRAAITPGRAATTLAAQP